MDEFLILLQAKLNEAASRELINNDIKTKLQGNLDKLKLEAVIDEKSLNQITRELEKVLGQKITVSNISVNTEQAAKEAQQQGKKIANAVTSAVESSFKSIDGFKLKGLVDEFNLGRLKDIKETRQEVNLLSRELNSLAKEYVKAVGSNNIDTMQKAFDAITNKAEKLRGILNEYGRVNIGEFNGLLDLDKNFLNYFKGKTFRVSEQELSELKYYGNSLGEINKKLAGLQIKLTAAKDAGIELNSVWEEMINQTGHTDLSGITNSADQFIKVVDKLITARDNIYGDNLLEPAKMYGAVDSKINSFLQSVVNESVKVGEAYHKVSEEIKQSSNSVFDVIVRNEQKKQEAYRATADIYKALAENESIIKSGAGAVTFEGTNNAAKEAQQYFRELLKDEEAIVATTEKFGSDNSLTSFSVNIKRASGEVETLKYTLDEAAGNFYTLSGSSINDSGAIKQIQQIEKIFVDYQAKLNDFKTSNSKANIDYSGFEKVLDDFKRGIGTVNDLKLAFNELSNSAKSGVQNLKSQSSSLDPVQQTINNMRDMPSRLKTLEANMSAIKDKSSLAGISIEDFTNKYNSLQTEMMQSGGKVPLAEQWTSDYRELMSSVISAEEQVKALKKAEASDDSHAKKQANYYSTIISNYREIYALKKKLITAGEEESEIIKEQIRSLGSGNASMFNQLGKQNLRDPGLDKQVATIKEQLKYDLLISEAHQKDKATQSNLNKAQKESVQITKDLEQAYKRVQYIKVQMSSLDKTKDSEKFFVLSQEEKKAQEEYDQLYERLRKRKNYDKEAWNETKASINEATESQIKYNNAKQQDSLKSTKNNEIAALENLKATWKEQGVLTDEVSNKLENFKTKLSNLSIAGGAKNFKTQLQAVKAEIDALIKEVNATDKFKINILPQVQDNMANGYYADQVQQQIEKYTRLGIELPNVQARIEELKIAESELNTVMNNGSADVEQQRIAYEKFQAALKNANSANNLANSMYMSQNAVDGLIAKLETFLKNNSAMTKHAKGQIQEWVTTLKQADVVYKSTGNNAVAAMKKIESEQRGINRLGLSWIDTLRNGMKTFSYWTSSTFLVMKGIHEVRQAIITVKELDTALVDLKKTTDATAQELEDFYYSANDTAKQLGVTTEAVILAASSWSRLGYSIKDAQIMAENSAILTSISPDIDSIEKSTDALVSVLKAYKIEAEDSLDGVISKINVIGNTQAVSNGDIIEFLTRSSSAMAEANNTLEQTIALGTAATEITRDAASIGQVLKTTSMRLRSYDEETESYSEDLEELKGKIANLTKTAKTPGGISLFTDETKKTYKSTYDILKDISEIYSDLSDKNQAELLEVLAGKRNGQAIAAIISNFSAAEKSMDSMANSAGNAMQEMDIIYESLEYRLNQLKETGTGIAQNLFAREDMKNVINVLNTFMGVVDKLTEKLGFFKTLGLGAGIFAGLKNVGIIKTVTSSVDETRKTLALFNKDLDTYTANWNKGFAQSGFLGGVKSIVYSGSSATNSAVSKEQISILREWNNAVKHGCTNQETYNRIIAKADANTQSYLIGLNKGKGTFEGLKNAQNGAKASTIGLTIAQTALNAAIGIGVGLLISLVVQGVNKLIHANDEAIEKAKELREEYENFKSTNKSNVTTLNELREEFEELSKGVSKYGDNVSLTSDQYERYKEIIQQIVGMSPSLAEGYSTENGYIADKNGLLERAIELQEIEYRNELRKITNLDKLKKSMSGYIGEYKKALHGGFATDQGNILGTETDTNFRNALWVAFNANNRENFSNQDMAKEIMQSLGVQNVEKELQKYLNDYGNFLYNSFWNDYADTIAENIDIITNALSYEGVGLDETTFNQNLEKLESYAGAYTDMKDSVQIANESIQTDLGYIAEYVDEYSKLSTEQKKFVADYLKGFNISDITSEDFFGNLVYDNNKMASVKNQIKMFVEGLSKDETMKTALADLYASPAEKQSIDSFIVQTKSALEKIKTYCQNNKIEIPLAISDEEKTINDLESQYQRVIDYTQKKFGGTYNAEEFFKNNSINTKEELDSWFEIAQACESAEEAAKKYLKVWETANKATSKIDMITSIQGLSDGFEILDKIYADIKDKGSFDYGNLADKKFVETFSELGEEYSNFIEIISSSPTDINACQKAFDDLIDSWINSKGILNNLSTENIQLTKDMLENMGVANAATVVNERLANSILKQKLRSGELWGEFVNGNRTVEDLCNSLVFTKDEMNALIAAYPELRDQFVKTEDGIHLEKVSIEDLIKALNLLQNDSIESQKAQTQVAIEEIGKRIKGYKAELDAIKDLASAYAAIYNNMDLANVYSAANYDDYLLLREDNPNLKAWSRDEFNELKNQADQIMLLGQAYENLKEIDIDTTPIDYAGGQKTAELNEKLADSAEKAAKSIEDANKKIADAQDKIADIQESLEEVDKKEHLANLKKSIEECSLLLERLDIDIDLLDMQMGFLDEDDYANRADLLAQKLQLLTNKGAALKEEFNRLANTTPISADEANEIASRISQISSSLRSNLKDWVEYTKELEQVRVDALLDSITTVDYNNLSNISDRFNKEIDAIERTLKRLKGESLFSDMSFFAPMMPNKVKKTELQKQQDMHSDLIAELSSYEDKVLAIQQQALQMEQEENQKAFEKERQDLIKSLQEQYDIISEAQQEILDAQGEYEAKSQASQKEDHAKKEAETQKYSDKTENIVTELDTWLGNQALSAPALDTAAWDGMVAQAQSYADQVKDIYSDVSNIASDNSFSINSNEGSAEGRKIAEAALKYLGVPYKWGGKDPSSGLDCSGLVSAAVKAAGYSVSDGTMSQRFNGKKVDKNSLQPGDLVFFQGSMGSASNPRHVGIYLGDGKFIHSPTTGDIVKISDLSSRKDFVMARRIVGYAKGTPNGRSIAKGKMLIGETNENEIIQYKDGSYEVVNEPTIRDEKDVRGVVGVEDTKKISYANGTQSLDRYKDEFTKHPVTDNSQNDKEIVRAVKELGTIIIETEQSRQRKEEEQSNIRHQNPNTIQAIWDYDLAKATYGKNLPTSPGKSLSDGIYENSVSDNRIGKNNTILPDGLCIISESDNPYKDLVEKLINEGIDTDKQQIDELVSKVSEQKRKQDELHNTAEELRKTIENKSMFEGLDTESWFSEKGTLNSRYYDDLELLAEKYGEEDLEIVKYFAKTMADLKTQWIAAAENVLDSQADLNTYFIRNSIYNEKSLNNAKRLQELQDSLKGNSNFEDYAKAIQFAQSSYREQSLEFLELENQTIMDRVKNDQITYNAMMNDYNVFSKELQKAVEAGDSTSVNAYYEKLQQIVDAMDDIQSEMDNLDDKWKSFIENAVEFRNSMLDTDLNKYASQKYFIEKDLATAELNHSRQDRYETQIATLKEVNRLLADQNDQYETMMDDVHKHAESIRKEFGYLNDYFTYEQIESWFNADGTLSTAFEDALILYRNNNELRSAMKEYAESISYAKQQYIELQTERDNNLEKIWDNERTLWDNGLKLALQTAENILSVHDTILTRLNRENDILQTQLDTAAKYSDKLSLLADIEDNYRDQIKSASNKKAEADANISALHRDSKYFELFNKFDVSKWVDVNGELTGYYINDINNTLKIDNKEMYELAQEFGSLLSSWSKMSANAEDSVNSLSKSLKSTIDNAKQMQIDATNTAINKIIEMIADRKERELNYLSKVHEKRMEQLEEEQDLIQKAYDRAINLLDDVKSEEDYERQLAEEQETADKLQQRIDYLSMSTADSDKMKALQLQKELDEQTKKINELRREHEYEQTKKALADDLEQYQEHFSDISDAENDHFEYNQQLIEERYSQENMYNEAIKTLYSETFQDFQSKGIYTYDLLYNKGNETAISLTEAYDNFATKTGEKFSDLGIEFNNLMDLFKDAARAIEAFESDALKWANSRNIYGLGDDYDYNISSKATSKSYGSDALSSSSKYATSSSTSGKNSSNSSSSSTGTSSSSKTSSSLYTPQNSKEADLIAEMKENSKAWNKTDDAEKQEKLHLRNQDLANIIGGVTYNSGEGRWYKNGLPLYHDGRITEKAQKVFSQLTGTILSNDEELAIIQPSESVIPDDKLANLIPDMSFMTKSLLHAQIPNSNLIEKFTKNNMSNNIAYGDISVVVQGNADKKTAYTIADEVSKVLYQRQTH